MKHLYGVRLSITGTMETVVHVKAENTEQAAKLALEFETNDLYWVNAEPDTEAAPIVMECIPVKK